MKPFSLFITALTLSVSAHAAPILSPAWQTTTELAQPESVIYHPGSKSLLVSNVNGNPNEADGNGFISQVSLDGNITKLHWLDGLNAPKGLALVGNTLYVADINELVAIDVNKHRIVQRYPAEGAKFLNDVAADDKGNVYVSDMMTNTLYRLAHEHLDVWLKDPALEAPNGLLVEDGKLIVGSWGNMVDGFATKIPGHLKQVDIDSVTLSSLGDKTPVGNLDGVESDGNGNYLVTDWLNGGLLFIQPNGLSQTLISLPQGSADHTVLAQQKLVIVPMMLNNQLLAFRIND